MTVAAPHSRLSLLLLLCLRHLLGGRFPVFLRYRWKRWLTAALGFAATIAVAVFIALRGSPVWGAAAFVAGAVILAALHRLAHGALPEAARGAYASAVTFVAVLGIAIAVMTLIVIVSVMDGFSRDIQEALLKTTPEVTVTNFDQPMDPRTAEVIAAVPGVRHADPFIESDMLMKIEGLERPIPVKFRGETSAARRRPGGPDLEKGSWDALDTPGAIVIGAEMARVYMLRPGDRLWFITDQAAVTPMGVMAGMQEVEVAGVFRSGFYEVDQGMVYAGLATAQSLLGLGDRVNGVSVSGDDPYAAPDLAARLRAALTVPALVMSWADTRRNLYEAMRTEKVAMFVIESLLILIASFNISSTLYMAVGKKTREIGLLRALGVTRREILGLFALEGFSIGTAGTLFGGLLGVGFALYLKVFPVHMPGGGSVYYIDTIPVHLSWGLVAATAACSIAISLAASILPALMAARLRPAKALRYE